MLDTRSSHHRRFARGQCEVCRVWCNGRLCGQCVRRFAAPVPRCRQCGLRLSLEVERCGACLHDPPPFTRTLCLADYAFPWDRLVADFKFHQRPELALVLAAQLVDAARADGIEMPHAFVAVPLGPRRLAERGYNQAWELARRIGAACARPAVSDTLMRRFDLEHQANLTRTQRLTNLRGAFGVDPRRGAEGMRGRHVALVDDVMTTGATSREATTALLQAGAARVDVWVLARTAAPADGG